MIAISASDDNPAGSTFKMDGLISSANYSSKRSIMVLFINGMCKLNSYVGTSFVEQ